MMSFLLSRWTVALSMIGAGLSACISKRRHCTKYPTGGDTQHPLHRDIGVDARGPGGPEQLDAGE
jgi:hypothetical protein